MQAVLESFQYGLHGMLTLIRSLTSNLRKHPMQAVLYKTNKPKS